MICQKCNKDFLEKEIECSHDLPKYMGGKDIDGRHNLCKRCHDIYERLCFNVAFNALDELQKMKCREAVKKFAKRYFNEST